MKRLALFIAIPLAIAALVRDLIRPRNAPWPRERCDRISNPGDEEMRMQIYREWGGI